MKGSYNLIIYNSKVRYELDLNRNITVVKGKSGTGKSSLFTMVATLKQLNETSGIHCNLTDKLYALTDTEHWKDNLSKMKDRIVVVDEWFSVMYDPEFIEFIQTSSHYYILITRHNRLSQYTFSVDSIYELVTESVNGSSVVRFKARFTYEKGSIKPDVIVTEDSNSGKTMYNLIATCDVVSAHGKDNIVNTVLDLIGRYKSIYIIADGAAFGGCVEKVAQLIKITTVSDIYLFTPESFEYMLLQSNVGRYVREYLVDIPAHCDSAKFLSWERYFTWLLGAVCQKLFGHGYSKSKLQKEFKTEYFKGVIREQLLDLTDDSFK